MNVPYVLLSTPKKRTKSPVCGLSPVVCFLPQNSLSFRHAKKSIFLQNVHTGCSAWCRICYTQKRMTISTSCSAGSRSMRISATTWNLK